MKTIIHKNIKTFPGHVKHFLSFVEIQTKLATVFPFLFAIAYVFYRRGTINWYSSFLYLIAAVIVDMAITATNNHFDTRQEEESTPHYNTKLSGILIIIMYSIASLIGLYLASYHGIILLLAGVACFAIGLFYTFGPMPISKSVFGEIFAGFTCGFLIMFIVVTINDPMFMPVVIMYDANQFWVNVHIDFVTLVSFGIVTIPAVFCIANILLANNICDQEKDRKYRYTLAHHIGTKNALVLFAILYYLSYITIIVAVLLGILPIWTLLTILTIIPVQKNITKFNKEQIKQTTFVLSVKNYTIIMIFFILTLVVSSIV